MCFGEAETDALTKGLSSAEGLPGILDVPGVTYDVTRVLECRSGEGRVVAVLGPQTAGQPLDRGVGKVDDFIAGQVIRWRKCLELQVVALASVPMPKAARTAALIRSRAWVMRGRRNQYCPCGRECEADHV